MLNIIFKNSIDAIKKSNIINKDGRIDDKIRNEIVRNYTENSDTDSQIFENDFINNNLINSKTRNIHTRIKSNIRRSNRLIKSKYLLNSVERNTNTTAFATIDEILIKKNEMRWKSRNSKLTQTIVILKIF